MGCGATEWMIHTDGPALMSQPDKFWDFGFNLFCVKIGYVSKIWVLECPVPTPWVGAESRPKILHQSWYVIKPNLTTTAGVYSSRVWFWNFENIQVFVFLQHFFILLQPKITACSKNQKRERKNWLMSVFMTFIIPRKRFPVLTLTTATCKHTIQCHTMHNKALKAGSQPVTSAGIYYCQLHHYIKILLSFATIYVIYEEC